jgi:hypothetical protein
MVVAHLRRIDRQLFVNAISGGHHLSGLIKSANLIKRVNTITTDSLGQYLQTFPLKVHSPVDAKGYTQHRPVYE